MRRLRKVDEPVVRLTLRKVSPSDLRRLEQAASKVRVFVGLNGEKYLSYVRAVGVRKPKYNENPPRYGIALYVVPGTQLPVELLREIEKKSSGEKIFQCGSREDFMFVRNG